MSHPPASSRPTSLPSLRAAHQTCSRPSWPSSGPAAQSVKGPGAPCYSAHLPSFRAESRIREKRNTSFSFSSKLNWEMLDKRCSINVGCSDPETLRLFIHSQTLQNWYMLQIYCCISTQRQSFPVYPERTFLFIEHLAQVEHKMLWKYLSFFLYWSKRLTATRGKKGKAIKRVMYHPTNFKTISVVIVCDHRQLFTWWWKHVTISSNKSLYLTHFHTSPCDQVCSFVDQICDDKPLLIFTAAVGDESIIKNIIKTPAEGDACACLSCYPHTPKMQISFR